MTINISATLKDGFHSRFVSVNLPILQHPLLPSALVDPRWARPFVFQDFSHYPFSEVDDVKTDFSRYVSLVNTCNSYTTIGKYKEGLLKIVDEHIRKTGRLLFPDMLMYVDCLAYLCYASDFMSEEQIRENYAMWAKYVLDNRRTYIKSSTRWGINEFSGSQNEADLQSCL